MSVALVTGASQAGPIPPPPVSQQKIDLPVPVGEPIKGVKIPQYDEAGNTTMVLTAETARKLDDRQVELDGLKVEFHDKQEKEIVIRIPHSVLDLESKVLLADSETLIKREDFEIVGETAEFDTVARRGQLKGRVHASFRNGAPAETQ